MFGGTPSNLAISIMNQGKVEIIAGVNLPMLIKLASVRETESLEEAVASAQEAGRKYINVASRLLNVERSAARSDLVLRAAGCSRRRFTENPPCQRRHRQPAGPACACRRQVRQGRRAVRRDIEVAKDDMVVPGTSIMGLMVLAAALGSQLEIRARGREAGGAGGAGRLVERGFDEN